MQAERGSSWIPGLRDNTTGTQNIPGPPSFMAGQMGPSSQPPRPPAVSYIYNLQFLGRSKFGTHSALDTFFKPPTLTCNSKSLQRSLVILNACS